MSTLYRNLRSFAARSLDAIHPRSIAWEISHARGPVHPVITRMGNDGLKVRIYSNDIIGKCVYQHGVFEASEVRLILRFLKPGMVFFDVGANFGQYTVMAAERIGEKGHVHSFEPSTRMFGELSFNVGLNNLQGRCALNNLALSDTEGIARLSRYEAGAEVFGSLGSHHWEGKSIVGYDEVVTTTLDTYVATNKIGQVDLIKMDIEGAELLALRGAEQLLRRESAPPIVIEMADVNAKGFGYGAVETWDYLSSLGYKFYSFARRDSRLSRAVRPDNFLDGANLLAVKQGFSAWGITETVS